jgi:hypothetical protein
VTISTRALDARYRIIASIDPGARTGMIAIAVDADRMDITQGRLVGEAVIDIGSFAASLDEPLQLKTRALKLFRPVVAQLAAWNPSRVVIENPTDAMPVWGQGKPSGGAGGASLLAIATGNAGPGNAGPGKRRVGGASRGTIATLGVHLGLCAAAAIAYRPDVELYAYHVTTQQAKKRKRGHVGWMQGNAPRPMSRDRVLEEMGYLLRTLRERPHSGILPKRSDIFAEPDENVLMALGVLNFHLARERGIASPTTTRGRATPASTR